jgi:hypothetical protein
MRKILEAMAIVAAVGCAAPASANWRGSEIAPPGYPWAACSAVYGCASPLYTRSLVAHRAVVVHRRHARVVRRPHARVVHRRVTHIVYRSWRPHHVRAAYGVRGGFQYIDDPRLAAVLAWGDIVNSPPR